MEHRIEDKPLTSKPSSEKVAVLKEKYGKFFDRVANTNIVPNSNGERSLEDLEGTMNQVFYKYGLAVLDVNDGKICMALSGGLDSTLALALLRNNFPTAEIVTFSMGGTVDHPDIQHARLASQKFSTTHHEYIPTANEIEEALKEYEAKFPEKGLKDAGESGDTDVYLLYKHISKFNPKVLLAHDGIDELMGGYWDHRKDSDPDDRVAIYQGFWDDLLPCHLVPLTVTSSEFGIDLLFPYLDEQVVNIISDIPLLGRSTIDESKKPLRSIARKLGVPEEILARSKRGQVGMLDLK